MDPVTAMVFYDGVPAGELSRADSGFEFVYLGSYLAREDAVPICRSLLLTSVPYRSPVLFPLFGGLLAEGWLLRQQTTQQKIDPADEFSLLLANGEDVAGAVSVRPKGEGDA